MDIDLIVNKLSRLDLINTEGDGIRIMPVGPLLFFSDGSSGFYADPRAAWQGIKALDQCSPEQFWDRSWLHGVAYDSLAEVWDSLETPQIEAAQRAPRSSDFISIGRLRRFGSKHYIIQTDDGDFGVIEDRETSKWRLTPIE